MARHAITQGTAPLLTMVEKLRAISPFAKRDSINEALVRYESALGIRVAVDPLAIMWLERFPVTAFASVLDAIVEWSRTVDLRWARVAAVLDFEDPSWHEIALKLAIAQDGEEALERARDASLRAAAAKARFDKKTRDFLDENLGIHVLWGAMADEVWRSA